LQKKSKEKLEREINETPYFTLLEDKDSAVRETAKNKLVLAIFDYCRNYWYSQPSKWTKLNKKYQIESEVGLEIMGCLKPGVFNPEKGKHFIHYLKRSIKNAINRCKKRYFRDNKSIDDTTPAENEKKEDAFIQKHDILNVIDKVFKSKQERIKPYLRALITLEILKAEFETLPDGYECIDYTFFEKYSNGLKKPTQKEVAKDFGRDETDASRTINRFYKSLRPDLR
jgi:hypothetical protein